MPDLTSPDLLGNRLPNSPEDANKGSTLLEMKPLDEANPVSAKPHIPSVSASAVLGESASLPDSTPVCRGVDFEAAADASIIDHIMNSFKTTGFQATNLALAVEQVEEMRRWRLSDEKWKEGDDPALKPLEVRKRLRARIFLSYTSNQISSGQREVLRFLIKNKMVDCIVTTAGGIEEDIMKCFQPTYMGDFKLNGRELRKKGINRIGNLLVPNKNYCLFEDWLTPLIETMHEEQDSQWTEWAQKMSTRTADDDSIPERFMWTPSKIIRRLGLEINNEDSVLYWAAKNNIPVFCPALTDGSVGDMLYFHSYKRPGFVLDINDDIRQINDLAVRSHASGMIILGGGLVKHHVCNGKSRRTVAARKHIAGDALRLPMFFNTANLMRNGANWSVYINTGKSYLMK